MQYSELPFAIRQLSLGDRAESIFEQVVVEHFGKYVRYGWERPEISMKHMTGFIRYTPDYYVASGHLMEVGGVGKDGIVKSMKVDKYEALKQWSAILRQNKSNSVVWFLWNSSEREYVFIDWPDIVQLVRKAKTTNGIRAFENDGNEYYPINWEWCLEKATVRGKVG